MKYQHWLVLLIVPLSLRLAAAPPPTAPPKGANEIFVAAMSRWPTPGVNEKPSAAGDENSNRKANQVELDLRGFLGQMPGLDFMIEPDTPSELFQQLAHLTKGQKRIRYLVIAGHGSGETPHISFRRAQLNSLDVDVELFQKRLEHSLKLNEEENNLYEQVEVDLAEARIQLAHQAREECRRPLKEINDAADGMAPGAVILLLNCSAARTPQAQEMSRKLGQALLGKKGGTVIASASDIDCDQAWATLSLPALVRGQGWATSGDYWVSGNWTRIEIPPQPDSFLFAAFDPSTTTEVTDGSKLRISPVVDPRRDSGKLLYSWNGGPPGPSSEYLVRADDNDKHRIDVQCKISDQRGRFSKDTYTVRIKPAELRSQIQLSDPHPQPGSIVTATAQLTSGRQPRGSIWAWRPSGGVHLESTPAAQVKLNAWGPGSISAFLLSSSDPDQARVLTQAQSELAVQVPPPPAGLQSGSAQMAVKGDGASWSQIVVKVGNAGQWQIKDLQGWRNNGTGFEGRSSGSVPISIDVIGRGGVSYFDYNYKVNVSAGDSPLIAEGGVLSKDGGAKSFSCSWDSGSTPGPLRVRAQITGGNPEYFTNFVDGTLQSSQPPRSSAVSDQALRYADCRYAVNDFAGAVPAYTLVLQQDPRNVLALTRRAYCRGCLNDGPGALQDFNQAVSLEPSNPNTYFFRAVERRAQGDLRGAVADYSQALQLRMPRPYRAYAARAFAEKLLGDSAAAIQDCNQALSQDPANAWIWQTRGEARAASGDPAGAMLDLKRSQKLKPDPETEKSLDKLRQSQVTNPAPDGSVIKYSGPASYSIQGAQVKLGIPALRCASAASQTSGSLKACLWATSAPFSGGSLTGYRLIEFPLGCLRGGTGWEAQEFTSSSCLAASAGQYSMVLSFEELTARGWVLQNWVNYPGQMKF
ncbi:MAG: tetratricopeptide repeat protein [Vulcanimicrobiota bacterium]